MTLRDNIFRTIHTIHRQDPPPVLAQISMFCAALLRGLDVTRTSVTRKSQVLLCICNVADAPRATPAPLDSRRQGASAVLQGYRKPANATCYIAAFSISLLHVPTFSNVGLYTWKKACGCKAQQTCFTCYLAGQVAESRRTEGLASSLHRLEWLFKLLNNVVKGLIAPKRRSVDLNRPETVQKHEHSSCRLLRRVPHVRASQIVFLAVHLKTACLLF